MTFTSSPAARRIAPRRPCRRIERRAAPCRCTSRPQALTIEEWASSGSSCPGSTSSTGCVHFRYRADSAEYSLAFRERTASTNPAMLNDVRAEAEPPRNNRCTPGWTDPDGSFQPPTYATFLHSADFTAFFRSPELLRGPVVLRGTLEADWPAVIGDPPPVRGTIAHAGSSPERPASTPLVSTAHESTPSPTSTDPSVFDQDLSPPGRPVRPAAGTGSPWFHPSTASGRETAACW